MNNSGIAILNDTDTYLSLLKESAKLSGIKQFIFFGKSKKSDISLLKVEYQKNNKFKVYVNVPGKKINFFNQFLPLRNQFIRVMPNMPAIIDQGMSCMVSNRYVSRTNKNKIELLFSKVGLTLWLKKEIEINKVTAISGSGPGYVFLFIDAFEKAALQLGLGKKSTKKLIRQTVSGSVNLLLQEKKSAEELANNIAIKGGTTEAALNILKKNNDFHNKLKKAVKAAFLRANALSK